MIVLCPGEDIPPDGATRSVANCLRRTVRLAGILLTLISTSSVSFAMPILSQNRLSKERLSLVQNVSIIGAEDERQPEEDFSKLENLSAQTILGRTEIKESISAVLPIECFYDKDGKSFHDVANGVLVCNKSTVLLNAHPLHNALCVDERHDFFCRILPEKEGQSTIEFAKPSPSQIKASNLCESLPELDDVAILKSRQPLHGEPLKIGWVRYFEALKARPFVNISANVGINFGDLKTKKRFVVSAFDDTDEDNLAKSDMDSNPGDSGSADLINQNGELVLLAIRKGMHGKVDKQGNEVDYRPYSQGNYTRDIFFDESFLSFLKQNVADSCLREITPSIDPPN